ncbi:MAG TPA: ACP S-malonyltransferase [Gemmatimonadaceae bacterium]
MDLILLFPGQGSQRPGMARDLAEAYPEAKAALDVVDAALGHAFTRVMFEGPAEELTATHNAQPALLAHGAAAWVVVRERVQPFVRAAAGHSLGEYTAWHAAGALDLADAVRLVRRRGELMHDAGVVTPGTMAAILGTLQRPIDEICEQASQEAGRVVAANYNTDEQIVVSGEIAAVERAMELAKEAGAKRALRLAVAGAFHSPLMAPAAAGLSAAIGRAPFQEPAFPVYSNVSAGPVTAAAEGRRLLAEQLTSPVRWAQLVRSMAERWPEAVWVELGPGAVLGGLVARLVRGARTLSCGTPSEVEKLLTTIPA